MLLRIYLLLVLAGSGCLAPDVRAAEALTLDGAVARALASNPALAAEDAAVEAVQRRADRESLGQPYVLGADLENVAGTGSVSGMGSAEATARVGRVIEFGGKRAARQDLGQAQVAQQRNLAATARLDMTFRTTTRFVDVMANQQRLAYAQQRLERARQTLREVQTWVAAARNPESDLRAAQITVAESELNLQLAEQDLQRARVTLSASWGALTPDFGTAAGDLQQLPAIEPFETLAANLSNAPEQRASLLEAKTIAARRRGARAAEKPDVNVNVGVRRLEAYDDQGLVMSFSMPLGSRSRAAYLVAEADAQLTAIEARRQADSYERHQTLFERYQKLSHARMEATAVSQRMLPLAEEALEFTRRGFEAGRFTYFALAQAQGTVFNLRERFLEANARYHMTLAEVRRLAAIVPESTP